MPKLEISDEDLEKEVDKLMPWSSKRYSNGRCDVHPSMFEDGEVKDWMTRRFTKKIVVLLQRGFSRREVAYRLGCHRLTIEMVATGRCWHHRRKVYVAEYLRPHSGRKPASNRPDKVKDNQLTFTDDQVNMLINEAKELMLEGSERMVRIKFPPMGEPPVDFPRAFGKQKTTTNSADFWPKWREYTPLSVLTYFSKLGKIDISEEELRLLDAKAKEMKKKLEQL
jgi:hypothetical protein